MRSGESWGPNLREFARKGRARDVRRARIGAWLSLSEHGLALVSDARSKPWTVGQIALIFGVSIRTVQLGLAEARELRKAVRNAAAIE